MRCPFCQSLDDKVVDTRSCAEDTQIRRRRECVGCGKRFTTYEKIEDIRLRVVKKDGRRVPFDSDRILAGLTKACEKRPVSTEMLESAAREIEASAFKMFDKEVPSRFIGEEVMRRLKQLDQVAYVRFASVYREFKDVSEFVSELQSLEPQGIRPGSSAP